MPSPSAAFVPPPPVTGAAPAPAPARPPVLTPGDAARHLGLALGLSTGALALGYGVLQGWGHGVLGAVEGLGLLTLAALLFAAAAAAAWPFVREIRHDALDWRERGVNLRDTTQHNATVRHSMHAWTGKHMRPPVPKADTFTINGETAVERAVRRAVERDRASVQTELTEVRSIMRQAEGLLARYSAAPPENARVSLDQMPVPHYFYDTDWSAGDTMPLEAAPPARYTPAMQTLVERALQRQPITIRAIRAPRIMSDKDWNTATAGLAAAGVLVKDDGGAYRLAAGMTHAEAGRRLA